MLVSALTVWNIAMFTTLNTAWKIDKISPAFVTQSVKRAVAEKAVEIFTHIVVTWEILALGILKKFIAVFFHAFHFNSNYVR